ncbi:MAG: hypothetical protein ACREVB_00010 [Burkholderiales bacterium]
MRFIVARCMCEMPTPRSRSPATARLRVGYMLERARLPTPRYASAYQTRVATTYDVGVSQIKRVPLAGGTTRTRATSSSLIRSHDLETDGSSLYWADDAGLRKMPIAGGLVTTLATGSNLESVGLDQFRVHYSGGSTGGVRGLG